MTQRFDSPVSLRLRRLVSALPVALSATLLGAAGTGLISTSAAAATSAASEKTDPSVDLSKVRLRVATYKGGDATLLKTACLADTPYTIDWSEFQSGNAMVEAMKSITMNSRK